MPDTPDINEIVTELRSFFQTKQPPVFGSQVGGFLKNRFPAFDYRTQYISLKQFLEAIFPGEVNFIGKHGSDDMLELSPDGSQRPVSSTVIPDTVAPDDGIELFRNPTLSGFLIYDSQAKQLARSDRPVESSEGTSSSLTIERMSHADQRALMREFANNYSAREDTRGFESILGGDDPFYWQKFYLIVKNAKLVQNWLYFRRTKVAELLEQRLKNAGIPEEIISTIVARASQMGTARRAPDASSASESRERIATRTSSIADLARTVISHLSETQIRDLKVPLGAVWDSFHKGC